MKVITDNEWKETRSCCACTSVIEIEFKDLYVPPLSAGHIAWACPICKTENAIDPKCLPKGRAVRLPSRLAFASCDPNAPGEAFVRVCHDCGGTGAIREPRSPFAPPQRAVSETPFQ